MAAQEKRIKSIAIIGAGAAGSISAAALAAEEYFDRIQIFERRESAGGTWIYDGSPHALPLSPGKLPPDTDPPISLPSDLPTITSPIQQERFHLTPIYDSLTTNVPSIAMSFSDIPFAYGPFVPHHIPRQYIEGYLSAHKLDTRANLSLNTTVEDVSLISSSKDVNKKRKEGWKLTLRKRDLLNNVDEWWEEEFDAVIFANGHYAVPVIPQVTGLKAYLEKYPNRITHSKTYRSPSLFRDKKVLVIGNSASGHDVAFDLIGAVKGPVYQSRRSKSRWDGSSPPPGISWKPIIKEYLPSGRIVFDDDTYLDDVDHVIYATGYLPSYPFWNKQNNGGEIWDYEKNKLKRNYQHTFFPDHPNLAIVGVPRALTFRSFEYQGIAIARLWSGRATHPLPSVEEQEKWEKDREEEVGKEGRRFHDILWEKDWETNTWLEWLYDFAGLGGLLGEGRNPPRLSKDLRWALEHIKKYPEPKDEEEVEEEGRERVGEEWVVVKREKKDLLHFI